MTEAQTTRILFEGKKAVGVEFMRHGQKRTGEGAPRSDPRRGRGGIAARSSKSPASASGELLQKHGIPVVHELKGVGENLQDHYMIGCQWRLKPDCARVNELSHG